MRGGGGSGISSEDNDAPARLRLLLVAFDCLRALRRAVSGALAATARSGARAPPALPRLTLPREAASRLRAALQDPQPRARALALLLWHDLLSVHAPPEADAAAPAASSGGSSAADALQARCERWHVEARAAALVAAAEAGFGTRVATMLSFGEGSELVPSECSSPSGGVPIISLPGVPPPVPALASALADETDGAPPQTLGALRGEASWLDASAGVVPVADSPMPGGGAAGTGGGEADLWSAALKLPHRALGQLHGDLFCVIAEACAALGAAGQPAASATAATHILGLSALVVQDALAVTGVIGVFRALPLAWALTHLAAEGACAASSSAGAAGATAAVESAAALGAVQEVLAKPQAAGISATAAASAAAAAAAVITCIAHATGCEEFATLLLGDANVGRGALAQRLSPAAGSFEVSRGGLLCPASQATVLAPARVFSGSGAADVDSGGDSQDSASPALKLASLRLRAADVLLSAPGVLRSLSQRLGIVFAPPLTSPSTTVEPSSASAAGTAPASVGEAGNDVGAGAAAAALTAGRGVAFAEGLRLALALPHPQLQTAALAALRFSPAARHRLFSAPADVGLELPEPIVGSTTTAPQAGSLPNGNALSSSSRSLVALLVAQRDVPTAAALLYMHGVLANGRLRLRMRGAALRGLLLAAGLASGDVPIVAAAAAMVAGYESAAARAAALAAAAPPAALAGDEDAGWDSDEENRPQGAGGAGTDGSAADGGAAGADVGTTDGDAATATRWLSSVAGVPTVLTVVGVDATVAGVAGVAGVARVSAPGGVAAGGRSEGTGDAAAAAAAAAAAPPMEEDAVAAMLDSLAARAAAHGAVTLWQQTLVAATGAGGGVVEAAEIAAAASSSRRRAARLQGNGAELAAPPPQPPLPIVTLSPRAEGSLIRAALSPLRSDAWVRVAVADVATSIAVDESHQRALAELRAAVAAAPSRH